jgi:Flp pilus assembly protein TadG
MFQRNGRTQIPILRRFRRDQRGVVAVEFAFIAIPFIAMLFASLEGALVFWSNQVLDEAVAQASRTLYTGGFQTQTKTAPPAQIPELFKKEVCDRVKGLLNCSEIKIDVRTIVSFASGVPEPILTEADGTRKVNPAFGAYNRPGPSEITLVRAAIEYPVYTSILGANKSNLSATKRLIISSAAFRTEQFE